MNIALQLMAALMSTPNVRPALPEQPRRKADHRRQRAKDRHSGHPGAKLARKAFLGEVGLPRPATTLQSWAARQAKRYSGKRSQQP